MNIQKLMRVQMAEVVLKAVEHVDVAQTVTVGADFPEGGIFKLVHLPRVDIFTVFVGEVAGVGARGGDIVVLPQRGLRKPCRVQDAVFKDQQQRLLGQGCAAFVVIDHILLRDGLIAGVLETLHLFLICGFCHDFAVLALNIRNTVVGDGNKVRPGGNDGGFVPGDDLIAVDHDAVQLGLLREHALPGAIAHKGPDGPEDHGQDQEGLQNRAHDLEHILCVQLAFIHGLPPPLLWPLLRPAPRRVSCPCRAYPSRLPRRSARPRSSATKGQAHNTGRR